MTDTFPINQPGCGRISEGPKDTLVERTLEFVREQLPKWRDHPDRPPEEAEERLNAQLCKSLNVASRYLFPMIHFHHEEKQTGIRRVDMSALPVSKGFIGQTYRTIYDPFLVFEGKRLPAPARNREREYVTGGAEKSGGIQRFKLALHGASHTTATMIGYIQKHDAESWRSVINQWICELAQNSALGDEQWSNNEQLGDMMMDKASRVSRASSTHNRCNTAVSSCIQIHHIWIEMAI
jgi:hypothetical protein